MAIQKKICMLGSFGVGKTSLVSQFVHSIFSGEYLSTIGVKIDKKEVAVNDQIFNLIVWDIAGDDRFDNLQAAYTRGASAYLLVIDGCRLDTLNVALEIKNKQSGLDGLPFICVINKADFKADWELQSSHIEELESMGWDIVMTSAKDKDSVEKVFLRLANQFVPL